MKKNKLSFVLFLFFALFFMGLFVTDVLAAETGTTLTDSTGKQNTLIYGPERRGASDDCDAVPYRMKALQNCIMCPLFMALFDMAQSMSNLAANNFAQPFANLLAIAMALYIAFETLKMVSSFSQQDVRKYLDTVGRQFFKVLLTYLFLTNISSVYYYIINPLLAAGFEFGEVISGIESKSLSKDANVGATLNNGIGEMLNQFIEGSQQRIAKIIALGNYLLCYSFHEGKEGFLPNFVMLIKGLILSGLGWIIVISFGFLLIDAVVELGIFGALLPFCVAAWPLKLTARYTSAGWKIFSGVFLTFAMAGVTLAVIFSLVASAVGSDESGANLDEIIRVSIEASSDEFNKILDNSWLSVLILIACAIISFKLTAKMSDLVSKFGGDAGPGIGSDMGKQAMDAGGRLAGTAAKSVKAGAGALADASGLSAKAAKVKDNVSTAVHTGIKRAAQGTKNGIKTAAKATANGAGNAFNATKNWFQGKFNNGEGKGGTGGGNPGGGTGGKNPGGGTGGGNPGGGTGGKNPGGK